ncbi:PilZ domain-containing protein [Vibrio europaeus]|uniref:Peptide chain release factor A n=1 Tax=Vibrio europaeus TaxID=300876 RepID=A0A178JFE3_9VIBR|nr:PilZ domain-containing protein [Vibrio europaeus]MDC5707240.1 PilZ domain-containing protein [Vibrio europaeus]MDC5712605.1 PilZ domain-containing protein [Vibrio europaeus]MDC5717248.1 PilZ domain-containing protein [Vibrio europaeus]MDC5721218.1 PilZ domain-containing protein [Vibrio europaeus]MDC5726548.1 PilZ domain-containing protein [Vibrio europaeus]
MSSFIQKRQFYRLRYPKRARPFVRFGDDLFQVAEVSEGGIRMVVANSNTMYKGLEIKGMLNLNDESRVEIEGAVLRFDRDEVIVQLRKGPTFKIMVDEQRKIRSKYPVFFARLREAAA